jgi:hypothetical protein
MCKSSALGMVAWTPNTAVQHDIFLVYCMYRATAPRWRACLSSWSPQHCRPTQVWACDVYATTLSSRRFKNHLSGWRTPGGLQGKGCCHLQ